MTVTTKKKPVKIKLNRMKMPERPPAERARTFDEVNAGYTWEMAREEASRCLFCKKPFCIDGCPVGIDIPGFIHRLNDGDCKGAYEIMRLANPLPAICGRVCPQETQCEIRCVLAKKGAPVAIGNLERFVGDWGLTYAVEEGGLSGGRSGLAAERSPLDFSVRQRISGGLLVRANRVAIIGSGPAGMACAQDLARGGVHVTIFEALHEAGGVLAYGIPPFRLPRAIMKKEIEGLLKLGVGFEFNKVIGRVFTIDQLMTEKGFDAVFIGTGAGLPKLMDIPGEDLCGVMSANEFLTRVNLMHGFEGADTPVGMRERVSVIGAGNTALDAARTALRIGAREVAVVYRRTEKEAPARVEEVRHAMEEGVRFLWLTAPVRLEGDREGRVREMVCVRMELGEPDSSGRRSPHPVPGSEFSIPADTIIYALGTVANPIIPRTTPALKTYRGGFIEADPETGMTSMPGLFAGGDITTGGATVVLALGAGRKAAQGILRYLNLQSADKEDKKEASL